MKFVLRFRKADQKIFNDIKNGLKTVETRAATPKYQKIKKKDTLVFSCNRKSFNREVVEVKHFKDIDSMVEKIDIKKIMPRINSIKEMKKAYFSFPKYKEKIKKFGLIAIKFRKKN